MEEQILAKDESTIKSLEIYLIHDYLDKLEETNEVIEESSNDERGASAMSQAWYKNSYVLTFEGV
jgi:hypothetical protein